MWAVIPGHGGRYEVSNTGQIRSENGILKQKIDRGYARVCLYPTPGKKQMQTVHALVAAAFIGPRPPGAQINHRSGVKTDNAATNLEYCTCSQNMKHAHAMGLQSNQGEHHSQAKLTDQKVRKIRSLLASGKKQSEVAIMMGIHQSAVSRANAGKRWGHVSTELGYEQANNPLVAG